MSTPPALARPDDPRATTWELIYGLFSFSALLSWVDLACSDHLQKEPLTAGELAERCGAQAPLLARLLQTMAALGFVTAAGGVYSLTEAGRVLCADAADSMRPGVLVMGEQTSWGAMRQLATTIRSGRSVVEDAHGSWYDYLTGMPHMRSLFQEFMTTRSRAFGRALADVADFTGVRTIVDVGGGNGTLLATVMAAHPGIHGSLVDLEPVVATAREFLASAGLEDRVTVEAGDFFTSVPAGADCYLLASVIHNWNDDQALAILWSLRAAMTTTSRALLVDVLLPDDNAQPHPGHLLDMRMMALFGAGHERTQSAYVDLLAQAGLRVTRIHQLPMTPVSLIEVGREPEPGETTE